MPLDILDSDGYYWSKGTVIHVRKIIPKGPPAGKSDSDPAKASVQPNNCFVTVRYEGWGSLLCEELPYPNERLALVTTYTKPFKCFVALSGLKKKDVNFNVKTESNKDVLNWTDVWPCKIFVKAPHQSNANAKNLLRNEDNIFVQPYMTYLLPHYLAKFMSHGGQWITEGNLQPWKDLGVNDNASEVTSVVYEIPPKSQGQQKGTDSYFVTNKFCQAYQTAQADPVPTKFPPGSFLIKNGSRGSPTSARTKPKKSNMPHQNVKAKVAIETVSSTKPEPEPVKRRCSEPIAKRKRSNPPQQITSKATTETASLMDPSPSLQHTMKRGGQSTNKRKRSNPPQQLPKAPTIETTSLMDPSPSLEPTKRRSSQTSATRRRSISPRPSSSKGSTTFETTTVPSVEPTSWLEHAPFLPPPIPITDMAFPNNGVRYLPGSNRWASVLRVAGNDLFAGSYTSQSEAAHATKLALQQSRGENGERGIETSKNSPRQDIGGLEVASSILPQTTRFLNFLEASNIPDAGKVSDLFNTSAESIVSAFEESQLRNNDQKQSSHTKFRLQDWMVKYYTHMQQLSELRPLVNSDVVIEEKNDRKKRRKQSRPRRLIQVKPMTDIGEKFINNVPARIS